jgi:ActR/RegA family two-component response regulator
MATKRNAEFTLLIVDNNPVDLDRWCTAAARAGGWEVYARDSFSAGLEFVQSRSVDVLVTDLYLTDDSERRSEEPTAEDEAPFSEGLELIAQCRAIHPRSRIVAVTGKGGIGTDLGASATMAGADDFISKYWKRIDAAGLLEMKLRVYLKVLRAGSPSSV